MDEDKNLSVRNYVVMLLGCLSIVAGFYLGVTGQLGSGIAFLILGLALVIIGGVRNIKMESE